MWQLPAKDGIMAGMLEGLGVGEEAERVYRFVLGEDQWDVQMAAERLDLAEESVRAALRELCELKLLEPDEEHVGTLRLVDPRVGLDALLHARRAALAAGQQRLERSQMAVGRLLKEFEKLRPYEGGNGTERILGLQAVVERLTIATREVRFESVAFQPLGQRPGAYSYREGRETVPLMGRNGVCIRTVRDFDSLGHPQMLEYIRDISANGDQIRFVDRLPMRMIILDRETAFVPLDPDDSAKGALQTTDRGTVAGLHALFERFWEIAAEVPDLRAEPRPSALSYPEREVLRLLAKGLTDEAVARQLDVSVRTVRRVVKELMDRVGARSRFELGFRAAEQGWPT